jgi:hypothetical protein
MDNPEAYTHRANLIYGRLTTLEGFQAKLPEYTEGQKKLIELEAKMFGVNPDTNPQGFVDAHAQFVTETEADLQESLPRIKDDVMERVSSYFAGDDEPTKAGLKDMMKRRLADTKEVGVYDSLSTNKDSGGFFNGMARQPHLVVSELALAVESSESHEDYKEKIEKVILAHEVMHGIFTSGTQATGMHDYWPIRNGLAVDIHTNPNDFMEDKTIKHGQWLNEATLESFRRDIFETEDVRYEPGVILLETLNELSPGLRDELVMGALDAQGPGPVFGKVEMLLGPTGIEEVEEVLMKVKRFADFPEYKATVIGMLPKDLQAKATEIFNRKELEVFGNREWYKAEMAKLAAPLLEAAVERPLE